MPASSSSSPAPKGSTGLLTLSQVLMAVHSELRQRLDPSVAHADDAHGEDGRLDALSEEDWNVVLYPVSELRPYLQVSSAKDASALTTSTSSRATAAPQAEHYNEEVLTNYVKCRCAELPMRLQTEAVLLRRHEYVVRQRMRELIELSEYVAVCGGQAPELRPDKAAESASSVRGSNGRQPHPTVAQASASAAATDDVLPSDIQQLLSVPEAARRLQRAQERIGELEKLVQQESWQRLRCSQRMVLMSEVTRALLRQVRCGARPSADSSDGRPLKRSKHE